MGKSFKIGKVTTVLSHDAWVINTAPNNLGGFIIFLLARYYFMNKEPLVMVMNLIPNNASAHTLTDVLANCWPMLANQNACVS